MLWQNTPYTFPLFLTALFSAALAGYIWQRRNRDGALALFGLICSVTFWTTCYAMQMASSGLDRKLFWVNLEYIGIVAVPAFWLSFALHYTNRGAWLRSRPHLLILFPILTLVTIWTNSLHSFFWSAVYLVELDGYNFLKTVSHTGFWIHAAYSYLLLLAGTHTLLRELVRTAGHFRRPLIAAVISAIAPWIGNALFIFDLTPFPYLDLTPFGFVATGLALGWGLFRFQLLDLVPIARELIIERLRDAIIVLDSQQRIIDLNPAAEAILERTRQEAIGRPIIDLSQEITHILRRESSGDFTSEFHQFGHSYELRASILGRDNNQEQGQLITLRDITNRLQTERQLRRLKEEADAARSAAEAANQAKTHFLAQMNHELRNPLTGIIGYAEMLKKEMGGTLNETQHDFVDNLFDSGQHMLEIVNDILDLARIESGRTTFHLEEFSVLDAIEEIERMARPLVARRNNTLQINVESTPDFFYADRMKVRQCLLNLLSNAAKFTEDGHISLGVMCNSKRIYFAVKDTGIGMTPAQTERIFHAYTQAEDSTSSRYGGTGLGLSISHHFARLMGGEILVESQLNQGSTFTLELPLRVELKTQ